MDAFVSPRQRRMSLAPPHNADLASIAADADHLTLPYATAYDAVLAQTARQQRRARPDWQRYCGTQRPGEGFGFAYNDPDGYFERLFAEQRTHDDAVHRHELMHQRAKERAVVVVRHERMRERQHALSEKHRAYQETLPTGHPHPAAMQLSSYEALPPPPKQRSSVSGPSRDHRRGSAQSGVGQRRTSGAMPPPMAMMSVDGNISPMLRGGAVTGELMSPSRKMSSLAEKKDRWEFMTEWVPEDDVSYAPMCETPELQRNTAFRPVAAHAAPTPAAVLLDDHVSVPSTAPMFSPAFIPAAARVQRGNATPSLAPSSGAWYKQSLLTAPGTMTPRPPPTVGEVMSRRPLSAR
jgi:hypothetical protein